MDLEHKSIERIKIVRKTTGCGGEVMGDLISRKALLRNLEKLSKEEHKDYWAGISIADVLAIVAAEQTAFDKEKVIEQLDGCRVYQFQGMLPDGRVCHFSDVIEIVERGGVE